MSGLAKDLKAINIIFRKYNVSLWLNWGTLLGAIRDKKFLDNDIDLATINLKKYAREKKSIFKELKALGFSIEEYNIGMVIVKGSFRAGIAFYDVGRLPDKPRVIYQEGLPAMFHSKPLAKKFYYGFMRDNPNNFKYFFFKILGGVYITTAIPLDIVCPLKKIKFYNNDFYVPNKPKKYLEYLYGENWKTPDPSFPHFVSKDNLDYFKGTFTSIMVKCPRCDNYFGEDRKDQTKPVVKMRIHCNACGKDWNQKVFIKGAVMRRI